MKVTPRIGNKPSTLVLLIKTSNLPLEMQHKNNDLYKNFTSWIVGFWNVKHAILKSIRSVFFFFYICASEEIFS